MQSILNRINPKNENYTSVFNMDVKKVIELMFLMYTGTLFQSLEMIHMGYTRSGDQWDAR